MLNRHAWKNTRKGFFLLYRAGKETKSDEWSGNYRAFGKYVDSYTEST